jgi:hypothetical protein
MMLYFASAALGAIILGIFASYRIERARREGIAIGEEMHRQGIAEGRQEMLEEVDGLIDQLNALPEVPSDEAPSECDCCREAEPSQFFNGEWICNSCRQSLDEVNNALLGIEE